MKNVMLVLSTSRTPDGALDLAVKRAAEHGAKFIALYVVEAGLADGVFDLFSDVGFIGDKPSSELSEAVMKEYRQRAYEELGRAQIKAMEAAVDFEPLTEPGDYVDTVLELAESREVDLLIIIKKRRSPLSGYFSRSPADELKELAPCEVVIFEEG